MVFFARQAFLCIAMVIWAAFGGGAAAQNQVFVQVEAQPTLADAEARVRAYAAAFPDILPLRLSAPQMGRLIRLDELLARVPLVNRFCWAFCLVAQREGD